MFTPAESIKRKRDGKELSEEELRFMVEGFLDGGVMEGQMAAFLMAVTLRGMSEQETAFFCRALLESGERLDLSPYAHVVDKHSTGGVGDKISIPLAPLAAACGCVVPMMSGRGLGHTGGTLDKLASIPGFRTDLNPSALYLLLDKVGCAMMAANKRITPADQKIYALRDVTGTIASKPLIAASIMSKKLAERTPALLLDVKVGKGAFMTTEQEAHELALLLVAIGKDNGCRTKAILTDMDQPLGRMVGNALEIKESIEILKGGGPVDSVELTVHSAVEMILLAQIERDPEAARGRVESVLREGKALERFREMVAAQGGDPRVIDNAEKVLPRARHVKEIIAGPEIEGILQEIDAYEIGMAGVLLGAGRIKSDDTVDPAVGFELLKKRGDKVSAGETLALIHWNDETRLAAAEKRLKQSFVIGIEPALKKNLLLGEVE